MELIDRHYKIQGLDVVELCKKYGTPLYVYDAAKMEEQYLHLKEAFSGTRSHFKYACKALTNINVLKLFKKLGAGLDTVSIEEVHLGLKAGFEPKEILFTPNCVSFREIEEAVNLGVVINIDNLSILEHFGHQYGNEYPVCIRINPHIMAGGNIHISTGHIDSKFGISIHQLRHVERLIKSTGINVNGLHMHTGSDILDVNVFLRGAEILLDVARDFPDLEFMDFGSGFKIPYQPGDLKTDVDKLGKELTSRFNTFCAEYGRELELWFEPGKYLVSEAGFLFAEVNVMKQTTATVFAGLNTGFNHLIRPMFYNSYHHIINVCNPKGRNRIYTIVGYICETDTFALDRKVHEISEGDILCFYNAGAYGFAMASNYNSRPRPAEVLIYEGKDYLIRRRETIEDLLHNQVEIEL